MKSINLLNVTAKEKVDRLPAFMKYATKVLLDCIDNIINGKCDDNTILSAISNMENNAAGKFNKDDLATYDEAAQILGFNPTNRVGLKKLLDKYGIKQVTIGKTKVGFKRIEIIILKDKLLMEANNIKIRVTQRRKTL